jgi:hypothetical protein
VGYIFLKTTTGNNTVYSQEKKNMALFYMIKHDRKDENPTSKPGYIFVLLVSGESRVKPAAVEREINLC